MTAHALHIQEYYNRLLATLETLDALAAGDEDDEREQTRLEDDVGRCSFVIKELLRMAIELDYADEMGRRRMWSLIRASPPPPVSPASLPLERSNTDAFTCALDE